jgi:predicted dehydrogenase
MEGVDVLDAHFEVLGEEGQLVLHCQQGLLEVASRKQQRRVEVNVADVSGYAEKQSAMDIEIAAFVNAVRTGTKAPVGVREGYEAMVAALAMDESSMERRPVTPSYETPGAD